MTPLVLVLVPFFLLPTLVVLVAQLLPDRRLWWVVADVSRSANYIDVLTSALTFQLYCDDAQICDADLVFHADHRLPGRLFLVFHVRNQLLAIGLFLICTVPFWTSNIIRMISWIPLLGKEGLVKATLLGIGVIREPLEVLLFSGLRGGHRLCPPADDLHDRADLQFAWRGSTSG